MDGKAADTRHGEDPKTHFRSDRIVCENGVFYFLTRENTQEGPFDTKIEASQELNLYIRQQNDPTRILRK